VTGPASVGKTTLALDLAAGLLCTALDPADRPCGTCRACRRVRTRGHPDLHWLAPVPPGWQILIGKQKDDPRRGVRDLVEELALAPLEGPVRVAVVEAADRMNEDAQNTFLKTLEEPPPASVIVLCTAAPDRLLPTIRSRCATLRLGLVATRAIEALLVERDLAQPPLAGRLARLAAGRPGIAVAYALAPAAVAARGEILRVLLDLLAVGPASRLRSIGALVATALDATGALDANGVLEASGALESGLAVTGADPTTATGRDAPPDGEAREADETASPAADVPDRVDDGDGGSSASRRISAADRRRAARWLVEAWRDLARDLLLVAVGRPGLVRDVSLLDELIATAARLARGDLVRFVERSLAAEAALEANASPELVLDVLALAWPRSAAAA
jgi:hypothetical protein